MEALKEIRELIGLSQQKMADWLNVSRSLVYLVERGERELPEKANYKFLAMLSKLEQIKQKTGVGKTALVSAGKLAELHQKEMEKHRQQAVKLQGRLRKLQGSNTYLQSRLALFDIMKDHEAQGYKTTDADKKFIEFMEWFTNQELPPTAIEQQELLQDKIDTHLAYADLHQQRLGMYVEMT